MCSYGLIIYINNYQNLQYIIVNNAHYDIHTNTTTHSPLIQFSDEAVNSIQIIFSNLILKETERGNFSKIKKLNNSFNNIKNFNMKLELLSNAFFIVIRTNSKSDYINNQIIQNINNELYEMGCRGYRIKLVVSDVIELVNMKYSYDRIKTIDAFKLIKKQICYINMYDHTAIFFINIFVQNNYVKNKTY